MVVVMMMRMYMMRLLMNTSRKSSIKILRQTPHHSRVHTNTTHFIVIQHLFGFDSLLSRLNRKLVISMNCKQRFFLWTIFLFLKIISRIFIFEFYSNGKKTSKWICTFTTGTVPIRVDFLLSESGLFFLHNFPRWIPPSITATVSSEDLQLCFSLLCTVNNSRGSDLRSGVVGRTVKRKMVCRWLVDCVYVKPFLIAHKRIQCQCVCGKPPGESQSIALFLFHPPRFSR